MMNIPMPVPAFVTPNAMPLFFTNQWHTVAITGTQANAAPTAIITP